jgi:acyl-CoA reductase-like NAD-dependent aldehyde dehydrogenase
VVLGSLVSAQASERVNALIADAVAKGGSLISGAITPGTILPAAIVDHVTPAMRIYRRCPSASGYGRFGGRAAIDEFTELRWITVQTGPRLYPF